MTYFILLRFGFELSICIGSPVTIALDHDEKKRGHVFPDACQGSFVLTLDGSTVLQLLSSSRRMIQNRFLYAGFGKDFRRSRVSVPRLDP